MQKPKPVLRLLITLTVILALVGLVSASDPQDPSGAVVFTNLDSVPIGGYSLEPGNALSLESDSFVATQLIAADYQSLYATAQGLLNDGVTFRQTELQLTISFQDENNQAQTGYAPILNSRTITDALKNYATLNGGQLFAKFCADYDAIDALGHCPPGSANLRNDMFDSLALFAILANAEPAGMTISAGGKSVLAQEAGRAGLLSAAREIANIHMIFGNEFLVDALDSRFSTDLANGDAIYQSEIALLEQALQQFRLAMDILVYVFNTPVAGPITLSNAVGGYLGDHFTAAEYETFGIASGRMIQALDEAAARYRLLGDDEKAIQSYEEAFTDQYLQALALAQKASEQGIDFFQTGGWEMLNNLGRLNEQAQAIRAGVNPFGFHPEYVPLQTYTEMRAVVINPASGFLKDAEDDEKAAREAQREFDQNGDQLKSELGTLRQSHNDALFDLCGNDQKRCDGGLMRQNDIAMGNAQNEINLALFRSQAIVKQIDIEQQRAGDITAIIRETGRSINALALAKGIASACRATDTMVDYTSGEAHAGVEAEVDAYAKAYTRAEADVNPLGNEVVVGGEAGVEAHVRGNVGYNHAWGRTASQEYTYDPSEEELARLDGLAAIKQAVAEAQIEGANSQAAVRNLLLQQTELQYEAAAARGEWNKLSAEHNQLSQQYQRLYAQLEAAEASLAGSYLTNPAYRILRDTLTVEAARSHNLAAQYAYLTAKALEYQFLTPIPFMNDIFKARTADEIDNFMIALEQWRLALASPGALNRFPTTISFAQHILGLTDEALDPDGSLSSNQLDTLRFTRFQEFIQQNTFTETVRVAFTTRLPDLGSNAQNSNNPFSRNIWNNRIAGEGVPLAGNEGVSLNVVTRQTGNVGAPEITLVHGGAASYRTAAREDVVYTPGPARLVGYAVPDEFNNKSTSATLFASVNGNGVGTPTSALLNLSVAAASWVLKIDLNSGPNANFDLSQLADIEIRLDSTGYALSGREREAVVESLERQATFTGTDLRMERVDLDQLVAAARMDPAYLRQAESMAAYQPPPACEDRFNIPRTFVGEIYDAVDDIPDIPLPPEAQDIRRVTTPGESTAPAVVNASIISGTYVGTVAINRPVLLNVSNLAIALEQDGSKVYGRIIPLDDTLAYSNTQPMKGTFDGTTVKLTSQLLPDTLSGRAITRQFSIIGQPEENGRRIRGEYLEVISGVTPEPIFVRGDFYASRPTLIDAVTQPSLFVSAPVSAMDQGAKVTISATFRDGSGNLVAGKAVTFSATRGTVSPTSATTNGQGVATTLFTAGSTPGQAVITATSDGLSTTTTIQIRQSDAPEWPIYLPAIQR